VQHSPLAGYLTFDCHGKILSRLDLRFDYSGDVTRWCLATEPHHVAMLPRILRECEVGQNNPITPARNQHFSLANRASTFYVWQV
jgi:hypothetical protein